MKRSWRREVKKVRPNADVNTDVLTALLKERAEEVMRRNGHAVGEWRYAKQRYGKGAQTHTCGVCGKIAAVTPRGDKLALGFMAGNLPGIVGAAVFEMCKGSEGEPVGGA